MNKIIEVKTCEACKGEKFVGRNCNIDCKTCGAFGVVPADGSKYSYTLFMLAEAGRGWEFFAVDAAVPAVEEVAAPAAVEGNEVIEKFFDKWHAEMMEWFGEMQKSYRNDYKFFMEKHRPEMSKSDMEMIRGRQLYPRQGCGLSISEVLEKSMKEKKAKLYAKINGKVGTVTEVELYEGIDGTPNGTVTGTAGAVNITTIIAGGYIQCVHYRVLVK